MWYSGWMLRLLVCCGVVAVPLLGCRNVSVPVAAPIAPPLTPSPAPPEVPALSMTQARDILAAAVSKLPKDPQPILELALFDLRINDVASAEHQLIDLRRKFPRFARAPYHLGQLYLMQGRMQEALEPFRAAASLAPEDARAQVNVGSVLLRLGAEPEARQYAERARKGDPKLPDAYLLLARLDDHHGTAKQAIENAKKYVELSPNPAPGLYMVGRVYARQADGVNAETWLLKAREADPNNVEIWVTLGRVYYEILRATRGAEGTRCFEKALELNPHDWESHLWLGRARMNDNQFPEAVTHFREALANAPQPGPIYYDLAQALLKAGQTTEGQKTLATYQSYREYTNGVKRLREAAEKAPRDRTRRIALARFCIQHHQYRGALSVLKETQQVFGADKTIERMRAEIADGLAKAGLTPNAPPSGADHAP